MFAIGIPAHINYTKSIPIFEQCYQRRNDKLEQVMMTLESIKYVATNQPNITLKQILKLGFIDIIRNKHKKIAKD
jgi:hypothetical protein